MKKLTTLNAYYEERLLGMVRDNGGTDYYGVSTINKVRPLYNRIVKNPVGNMIAAENDLWRLAEFARHIARGEYLATSETVAWYILDQYAGRRQITLEILGNDNECFLWHRNDVACKLRGFSIKHPELLTFWDTNGQNAINLTEDWNRQNIQ